MHLPTMHQTIILIALGDYRVGLTAHGLILPVGSRHDLVILHQLAAAQGQTFVQVHAPAGQANLGKVANDQPRFSQHLAIACAISRGIAHQRGMATRHRINAYPCPFGDRRDHAGKSFGTLIP
ncbi:hypothetical protein D3C71_1897040 [compost metagenome]